MEVSVLDSNEPVGVVPYDPSWPTLFAQEREKLIQIFSGIDVRVEHIGSTAVPGLGGKPVIDILVGVIEIGEVQSRLSELEKLGYRYVPEFESQNPERQFFVKKTSGVCSHHLHTVEIGGEFWRHYLLFRDYLRAHEAITRQYFETKEKLAGQFKDDRESYTNGKSVFIKRVLSEAEEGFCPFC